MGDSWLDFAQKVTFFDALEGSIHISPELNLPRRYNLGLKAKNGQKLIVSRILVLWGLDIGPGGSDTGLQESPILPLTHD